jgi:hypothetical protein
MNQAGLNIAVAGIPPAVYATGLFPSLATLQAPSTTQGPTGNLVNTFTDVVGLIALPCQDAPPSTARIAATEVKAVAEIMSKGMRHVTLMGYFEDAVNWSAYGYRVVVDGIVYDVLGAENSSLNMQTRMDLQLVTV